MRRDHWKSRNDALDPATDYVEISRNVVMHEFPWDMNQALSFALFRTYAVPGIGRLLYETGQFTEAVQKRYDDTALLLEPPTRVGFEHPEAKAAIRRINAMHRAYDIPNDEFRYVLSTFVVVPKRWMDDYGKRPFTANEIEASVQYYRVLGRHMNIKDVPETYAGFEELMDSYEAEHFAYDEGARQVADSTLALMQTFYAKPLQKPAGLFARALMDQPLRDAFRYDAPPLAVQSLSRAALKARGVALRAFPARRRPKLIEDISWIRSYPDGYDVEQLGTFPVPGVKGCPVRHEDPVERVSGP
ncbi:oxygenase MpaB family protein [Nocardioides sp. SR21]|uniref:oxygenase MpaB family protein n=1 Tax=Nocardioides sp. SR21 TaxID=2919501 RepID=UPI001FAA21EC|nr:oxygenase MpaB family protein [Nocardioides sp. SR21]